MLEFIICALTNLFRIYLIYKFVEVFLGKAEKPKWITFIVCASYYVSNIFLYWVFHTAWINLTCNLIGVCAIVFLFTKSIKTNLFITISVTLINMVCDVLATLPFIQYEDGQSISQICEILTDFYILICWFLIGKIVTIRKKTDDFFRISLISVPICSMALILFLTYYDACTYVGISIIGVGLLVINFFMFYLYNQLLQSISHKFENELLEQKLQIYSNQLNVIMQSEEKVKALRHDMKHHINELMILANMRKSEEIENYLTRMNESLQNPEEIVSSGNTEIDSVLNYLLCQAKEELLTVNIKVALPEELKHTFDAIVLLGNLLENAIEAARQTDRKYLSVNISLKKGVLLIQIDNSYLPAGSKEKSIDAMKSFYIQRGKQHQGLGLKNVKRILEAHNGSLEITKKDDVFSVKALLYTTTMK